MHPIPQRGFVANGRPSDYGMYLRETFSSGSVAPQWSFQEAGWVLDSVAGLVSAHTYQQ